MFCTIVDPPPSIYTGLLNSIDSRMGSSGSLKREGSGDLSGGATSSSGSSSRSVPPPPPAQPPTATAAAAAAAASGSVPALQPSYNLIEQLISQQQQQYNYFLQQPQQQQVPGSPTKASSPGGGRGRSAVGGLSRSVSDTTSLYSMAAKSSSSSSISMKAPTYGSGDIPLTFPAAVPSAHATSPPSSPLNNQQQQRRRQQRRRQQEQSLDHGALLPFATVTDSHELAFTDPVGGGAPSSPTAVNPLSSPSVPGVAAAGAGAGGAQRKPSSSSARRLPIFEKMTDAPLDDSYQ